MGKSILLTILFFTLTPLTIGLTFFSLFLIAPPKPKQQTLTAQVTLQNPPSGVRVYASLPETMAHISGAAVAKDARAEIIKQYLASYGSPLTPYAQKIVEEADKNAIDFRLVTAIAQQESSLCKKIPAETYNCWGWGIHSRGTLGFSSYEEGIEVVSQGLKESYIDMGYKTPEEIMSKYTPLSLGSWAAGVSAFMQNME
jgi:hypothetical protein